MIEDTHFFLARNLWLILLLCQLFFVLLNPDIISTVRAYIDHIELYTFGKLWF